MYKIYLKRYALKNYNLLVLHLAKVKIVCLPFWDIFLYYFLENRVASIFFKIASFHLFMYLLNSLNTLELGLKTSEVTHNTHHRL